VKARLDEPEDLLARLVEPDLSIVRSSVRNQFDTYFLFEDREQGRLRYREDEVLSQEGKVHGVFYTITLMGPAHEREYDRSVVLTRSRYMAPADRSLRFYSEYFKADEERQVVKYRRRYHILYQDTDLAINVDRVRASGEEGYYLEIKSHTWSARDAEHKAELVGGLMDLLGIRPEDCLKSEYVDFVAAPGEAGHQGR
jgi:5-methylthioadenosine/S-adenosylhomocysteine deaminase